MRIDFRVGKAAISVRDLDPEDEDAVLDVFTACEDWFVAETGRPSVPADVQSALYALPAGSDVDDKVLLVIEADGAVVGFIDAVLRDPHIASIGIGTFVIRPEFRRRGIGGAVARALFDAAAEADFAQISTQVAEGWAPGRRFLAAVGFTISGPRLPSGNARRNPGPCPGLVIPALIAIG